MSVQSVVTLQRLCLDVVAEHISTLQRDDQFWSQLSSLPDKHKAAAATWISRHMLSGETLPSPFVFRYMTFKVDLRHKRNVLPFINQIAGKAADSYALLPSCLQELHSRRCQTCSSGSSSELGCPPCSRFYLLVQNEFSSVRFIKELDLELSNITDTGLCLLSRICISSLNISRCKSISIEGFRAFIQNQSDLFFARSAPWAQEVADTCSSLLLERRCVSAQEGERNLAEVCSMSSVVGEAECTERDQLAKRLESLKTIPVFSKELLGLIQEGLECDTPVSTKESAGVSNASSSKTFGRRVSPKIAGCHEDKLQAGLVASAGGEEKDVHGFRHWRQWQGLQAISIAGHRMLGNDALKVIMKYREGLPALHTVDISDCRCVTKGLKREFRATMPQDCHLLDTAYCPGHFQSSSLSSMQTSLPVFRMI